MSLVRVDQALPARAPPGRRNAGRRATVCWVWWRSCPGVRTEKSRSFVARHSTHFRGSLLHTPAVSYTPLRLGPGTDLRRALDGYVFSDGARSGFVIAGLGSLSSPRLRFAAAEDETTVLGPVELVSISGSLSEAGAHIHVALSTQHGQVLGGHLCYGSQVRTTVELLLVQVSAFRLSREFDANTGYKELAVRPQPP